jgi:hypothetical protein
MLLPTCSRSSTKKITLDLAATLYMNFTSIIIHGMHPRLCMCWQMVTMGTIKADSLVQSKAMWSIINSCPLCHRLISNRNWGALQTNFPFPYHALMYVYLSHLLWLLACMLWSVPGSILMITNCDLVWSLIASTIDTLYSWYLPPYSSSDSVHYNVPSVYSLAFWFTLVQASPEDVYACMVGRWSLLGMHPLFPFSERAARCRSV